MRLKKFSNPVEGRKTDNGEGNGSDQCSEIEKTDPCVEKVLYANLFRLLFECCCCHIKNPSLK